MKRSTYKINNAIEKITDIISQIKKPVPHHKFYRIKNSGAEKMEPDFIGLRIHTKIFILKWRN